MKKTNKIDNAKEISMKYIFLFTACMSIIAVILISVYLFANGIPAMRKIGFAEFLLSKKWMPGNGEYGIFPMIIGSLYVTAGAILIGVPIGVFTAVFMAFYCPMGIYRPIKALIEVLAGIPSVVYGFFGLVVIVPTVRDLFGMGNGLSILSASILLGMMILPTIIGLSESAIRAVPENYFEGALALGATKERTIFLVMLPAAKSGLLAGVVLGIGRAIGETMAVVMVAGNQTRIPEHILQGVRTLTANIVLEMGYATDLHRESLIATAVVLFVFILLINFSLTLIKRRTD